MLATTLDIDTSAALLTLSDVFSIVENGAPGSLSTASSSISEVPSGTAHLATTSHTKVEVIIGTVVGALIVTFTGVILALFRRRHIRHRRSKSLLEDKTFAAPYDLKFSGSPDQAAKTELLNVKLEATLNDNEIVRNIC